MGIFGRIRKAMKQLGGAEGDAEALQGIKTAALVSCTIDPIAPDNDESEAFSRQVADCLAEHVQAKLAADLGWEMTDPGEVAGNEDLTAAISLAGNEELRAEMGELFDKQKLPIQPSPELMRDLMGAMLNPDRMAELKEQVIDSILTNSPIIPVEGEALVGARELPIVSYAGFNPDAAAGVRTFGGDKEAEEFREKMKATALSGMAAALGVDAIVIVYARTSAEHVGDISVIVGENDDRVQGTIKMNAAIVVITADGEVALDSGYPGMDDLAPTGHPPLFKHEEGRPMDLTHEPVLERFCELAEKNADKLVGTVRAFME